MPEPWLPILPGFHPDPSICRVGDDYFLITSTFEYLPGVPIYHSRDLVNWSLIGHVLDRPDQLPRANTGGGIYAPTLRHRDGVFWMVTTDVDRLERGQLLVSATDAAGPWSEPLFIAGAIGIDPDLVWDGEGRCLLTWAGFADGPRILQAEVDLHTALLVEAPRTLWRGTGLAFTEGPHLYERDGWWYLMVAEGGTERGHGVSVARSRSPRGPFESHPSNPVYSHRSRTDPVQNIGHADLVERPEGSWAAVHLGVRPRGVTPGFHVNGRETFLSDVEWEDGWPSISRSFRTPRRSVGFDDSFSAPDFDDRWVSPGRWLEEFARADDGLRLRGSVGSAILARVTSEAWTAELTLVSGDGALLLRLDDDHFVRVAVSENLIEAHLGITGGALTLESIPRLGGPVTLTMTAEERPSVPFDRTGPDRLRFGVRFADGELVELGDADGRYVSTEVAGGFTGRMIGAELLGSDAHVSRIRFTPDEGDSR